MKTTYIVGGFMRSGTSMMMHCLEAGGLRAVYSLERDAENETRWADDAYHPNAGGFYEMKAHEYRDPAFLDRCEGKLVKCLRRGPLRLPNGRQYSIVIMRRDGEEIRQSAQAIFSADLPRSYGDEANRMIDKVAGELEQRPNWRVSQVQYRDVVEHPLIVFGAARLAGWPIEPGKAASVVNPTLCRFRKEALHVGV